MDNEAGEEIVAAPPLTLLQLTELMEAPLFPEAVPVKVAVLVGSVMVCADPAPTLGATFPVVQPDQAIIY